MLVQSLKNRRRALGYILERIYYYFSFIAICEHDKQVSTTGLIDWIVALCCGNDAVKNFFCKSEKKFKKKNSFRRHNTLYDLQCTSLTRLNFLFIRNVNSARRSQRNHNQPSHNFDQYQINWLKDLSFIGPSHYKLLSPVEMKASVAIRFCFQSLKDQVLIESLASMTSTTRKPLANGIIIFL